MVRTLLVTQDNQVIDNVPLHRTADKDVKWFWVDFEAPDSAEAKLLSDFFHFHPLSIEDCFQFLQRPKHDHYEEYDFFVFQNLQPDCLDPQEIDLFLGPNYAVTFHLLPSREIDTVREKLSLGGSMAGSPRFILYVLMDIIVDEYFPFIYALEDKLSAIDSSQTGPGFITSLYQTRDQLLSLRRVVMPMWELLYRMLNNDQLSIPDEERLHFKDIDDHLVKIAEMIESSREITADIRDSYLSLNSFRMNSIMKTLTIIASIFIPLTFVVGVYGMNFDYMPELRWHWGYFASLALMAALAVGMLIGFWVKGWFD